MRLRCYKNLFTINIQENEVRQLLRESLSKLEHLQNMLLAKTDQQHIFTNDILLDSQDVVLLLKISTRTLQRYRSQKKINYYIHAGKVYYHMEDVKKFVHQYISRHIAF